MNADAQVRRLTTRDRVPLTSLLCRDMARNAFMLGWLEHYGIEPPDQRLNFSWFAAGPAQQSVALVAGGALAVLATGAHFCEQLGAECVQRFPRVRTITGPDDSVKGFWSSYEASGRNLACDAPQTTYLLRPAAFAGLPRRTTEQLRIATSHDVPQLLRATVQMHESETGLSVNAEDRRLFARSVAYKVEQGRIWCVSDPYTDQLLFKASTSASTRECAQIAGVWVTPERPGQGVGAYAMASLCAELLQMYGALSLYVATDNVAAIRLYEAAGFGIVGPHRTLHLRPPVLATR